jgi:hypothetical protein
MAYYTCLYLYAAEVERSGRDAARMPAPLATALGRSQPRPGAAVA